MAEKCEVCYVGIRIVRLNSSRDLSAAETACANRDTLGRSVNYCVDTPNVRFPFTIAAPMGVTDLDTKRNSLTA